MDRTAIQTYEFRNSPIGAVVMVTTVKMAVRQAGLLKTKQLNTSMVNTSE